MQDLRLVLIILGFIAIAALIAHGLWSNKKNQVKPLKDKPLGKVDVSSKDQQGFDLDGIGEKRVVTKSVEPTMGFGSAESAPVTVEKIEPQFSAVNTQVKNETPEPARVVTDSFSVRDTDVPVVDVQIATAEPVNNDLSYDVVDVERTVDSSELQNNAVDNIVDSNVVNSTAVVAEKPASNDVAGTINEPVVDNSVHHVATDTNTSEPVLQEKAVEEAVFVINIMAREGKNIAGAALLQELSAFGFKFGAMDIFHRHVDAAGKGPVIFSLANMVKPGIFDIDTMEQFESPGVSLFMMFPCAGQASHNYSLMLSAAERIADGVDGILMNASRNPLTEDEIEQEQVFIRGLESRSLIK